MKTHINDDCTEKMEKLFPNADWKCYEWSDGELAFHGYVCDRIAVFIFQKPDSAFLKINTNVKDLILSHIANLEDDVCFLLHNDVLFNVEEFGDALRKIFDYAEYSIKRDYFEQKREEIYGERYQQEQNS